MRYRHSVRITGDDLGRRVTVRYRTSDGAATDVVGILERFDESTLGVRNRSGELVLVERELVLAAKIVQ